MTTPQVELSEEHTEIYDRQIRVWGLESQKKLSNSKIFISTLDCINFEIAKNCILSGINLNLSDTCPVTQSDLDTNLFFTQSSISFSRESQSMQSLVLINSLVQITTGPSLESCQIKCHSGDLESSLSVSLKSNPVSLTSYYIFSSGPTILAISDYQSSLLKILSEIPVYLSTPKPRPNLKFHAFLAVLYSEYTKSEISDLNTVVPLSSLKAVSEPLRLGLSTYFYPSAQIAAGLISQDIIKHLTSEENTFQVLMFDGETSIAYIDKLILS